MDIVLGILALLLGPMGGACGADADNSCGPRAIACIVEQVNGCDYEATMKRVTARLTSWERLPGDIPQIGRATFPWGICRAVKEEGLEGRPVMGSCELSPGQEPFIALVLEEDRWHYVAVTEVRDGEVVTNDGCQTFEGFVEKWVWSDYWRWQTELSS
ncbi:MAG: hypothetical protein ACLFVK_03740 [Dehalococcoidia bacterium]